MATVLAAGELDWADRACLGIKSVTFDLAASGCMRDMHPVRDLRIKASIAVISGRDAMLVRRTTWLMGFGAAGALVRVR